MSQPNIRAEVSFLQAEANNLGVLLEYGKAAWEADNIQQQVLLDQARKELEQAQSELVAASEARARKAEIFDRELSLVETDLFSYVRNNEKTLVGLKRLERQARGTYEEHFKGKEVREVDRLAENLLTQ